MIIVQSALRFVGEKTPLAVVAVLVRWGWVLYRELRRDQAFMRASGMAYATLVALVPSLVLVYGILSATGAGGSEPDKALIALFDQVFGEVPGVRDVLLPGLLSADLAALGVVATLALMVVAARLYLMVEKAYCDVFGVPVQRGIAVRLLNFYFTITAVPVALVFTIRGSFEFAAGMGVTSAWIGLVLQYVLLVAALKMLPATTVRWGPALFGGAVSWVLLELGRRGLSLYVVWFASENPLQFVYGSLGFFPIFLSWIYLIWVFVLVGVEVAQVSQNYTSLLAKERELLDPRRVAYPSVDSALHAATWVAWSFVNGRGPITLDELASRSEMEGKLLHDVLAILADGGIVVNTESGWVLARPAADIPLAEVVEVWRGKTVHRGQSDGIASELDRLLALDGSLLDGVKRWAPQPRLVPDQGA